MLINVTVGVVLKLLSLSPVADIHVKLYAKINKGFTTLNV